MTALIALAATLAGGIVILAGALIWLTSGRIAAADKLADARVAQVATEGELERASFQLKQARGDLVAASARNKILEEAISDAINSSSEDDVSDPLAIQLRIAREWAATDASERTPTDPGSPVSADSTTQEAGTAVQPDR